MLSFRMERGLYQINYAAFRGEGVDGGNYETSARRWAPRETKKILKEGRRQQQQIEDLQSFTEMK